jgi:hypothetical protein
MIDSDPKDFEAAARNGPQTKPYNPIVSKDRDTPINTIGSSHKGDLERSSPIVERKTLS